MRGAERTAPAVTALLIVLLAGALRFWALDLGLPHPLTRPDEEVVLAQTGRLARGLRLEWSVYPNAYLYLTWLWGEAGLAAGAYLGWWPPATYASVLRDHMDRLILIGRWLSALAGTAAVALLLLAARVQLGWTAALVGGVLLATSFLHVRDSHALKPDALFSLAVVAALWAMVPLARAARPRRAALAGAAVGLAMWTKYPAVLLCAPLYLAAVCGAPGRGWRRLLPATAVVAGVVAFLVFLAGTPSLVVSAKSREVVGFLASTLLPSGAPGSIAPDALGPSPYAGPWWQGFVYHVAFSLRWGAGLLPTLLLPVAIGWGLFCRRPLPLLAAVFVLAYYLVVGSSPVQLARYMTPLVPALALLEGGLVGAIAARVPGAGRRLALAAVLALALAAEPLARAIAHDRIAARTDTRVLATRWMAAHLPPGAEVAVLGTWFWGYGVPQVPPGVRVRQLAPDPALYAARGIGFVVTHDHPVPFSHVDPAALARLAPRLQLLADFSPFRDGPDGAVFEPADAYYLPFHGYGAMERPGPHVRIYAFR
jgi:hypothetical protein